MVRIYLPNHHNHGWSDGCMDSIKTSEQILTSQKRDEGCKLKGVDGSAAKGSGLWSNLRIEPFLKNTLDALKDNCYIE